MWPMGLLFFKNTKRQNITYLECVNILSPYKRKVGSDIVPLHTLSILLANCLLFSSLSKDCMVSENISNDNCENSPLLYDIFDRKCPVPELIYYFVN